VHRRILPCWDCIQGNHQLTEIGGDLSFYWAMNSLDTPDLPAGIPTGAPTCGYGWVRSGTSARAETSDLRPSRGRPEERNKANGRLI